MADGSPDVQSFEVFQVGLSTPQWKPMKGFFLNMGFDCMGLLQECSKVWCCSFSGFQTLSFLRALFALVVAFPWVGTGAKQGFQGLLMDFGDPPSCQNIPPQRVCMKRFQRYEVPASGAEENVQGWLNHHSLWLWVKKGYPKTLKGKINQFLWSARGFHFDPKTSATGLPPPFSPGPSPTATLAEPWRRLGLALRSYEGRVIYSIKCYKYQAMSWS